MIVVCERCSTRFQLDETRIPARGAQVRCSRCKHAFFVAGPGSTTDSVVQEAVAEATGPGGSSAPTVTTDLDRTAFDTGAGAASDGEDDEWEFNEDPPSASRSRPAPAPARQKRPPEPKPDASVEDPVADPASEDVPDSLLDELGDPKDWDFGAESNADAAPPADGGAPAAQESGAEEEAAASPAPRKAPERSSRRKRRKKPAARKSRVRSRSPGQVSSLLLEGVGYLAVALLFGVGLGRVVERGVHRQPLRSAVSTATVPVTGGGADGVRVGFVENATAGTIVVISGRRSPGASGTALRVEWTDHGRPIPGSATWAGPKLPSSWLREADPGELRHLLAAAAVRPALPSEVPGWELPPADGFVAVYDAVPPQATGLRISAVALPGASPTSQATPPVATQKGTAGPPPARTVVPGAGGAGGSPPAPVGDATSPSSPPSPRPSSE